MTEAERTTARKCRDEGKHAWLHWKDHGICPYDEGTFEHHCWKAGYYQQVANEEQLFNQWSKS